MKELLKGSFNRTFGNVQLGGDLLVAQTLENKMQDLTRVVSGILEIASMFCRKRLETSFRFSPAVNALNYDNS